jgi:hypothetical protein
VQLPGVTSTPCGSILRTQQRTAIGVVISYDKGRAGALADLIPVVQFFNVAFDMDEPFRV